MRKMKEIIAEFFGEDDDDYRVLFYDRGNGAAFGVGGHVVDYVAETMAELEMRTNDELDANEPLYMSEWQTTSTGYEWRIGF